MTPEDQLGAVSVIVGEGVIMSGDSFIATANYEIRVPPPCPDGFYRVSSGPLLECRLTKLTAPLPPAKILTLVMNDARRVNICAAGDGDIKVMGRICDK
jgi:hypothetical protein